MRVLSLFVLSFIIINSSHAARLETFFAKADVFFKGHVKSGKVDYSMLKTHLSEVDELLKMAEIMSLSGSLNSSSKAFYINTYNLIVIQGLTKGYPVSSPKAITGFYNQKKHKVNNVYYTLEGLREKMLGEYPDARICFALCEGAIGSPLLANSAYKPQKLEEQLNTRTKIAINNANFIRIKPASNKVVVSEVLKWNKGVFGGSNGSILNYLDKFLKEESKVPSDYTLDYYPFDWRINEG